MDYRTLGNSGLRVSALGIGGWQTFGVKLDHAASRAILRAAVERGVNLIDLADSYERGAAERAVGSCLADFPRDKIIVASKVYWPTGDDPNDRGLSRARIARQIELTLKNLRTDYLDLYFCHREDPATPLYETVRAMDDLVRQGKIRCWGTSNFTHRVIDRVHRLARREGLTPPVVEQPCYNLLNRGLERWLLPTTSRWNMGLTTWGALAGGLLAGGFETDCDIPEERRNQARYRGISDAEMTSSVDKVRALAVLGERIGARPAQLAIAWLLTRPHVSSVITGSGSLQHLEEDIAAADLTLTPAIIDELSRVFPPPPMKLADVARLAPGFLSSLLRPK